MRSLKFAIYVRPFGPFVLVKQARSQNYTASSSCAKSLQFRFHILGYNFNQCSQRGSPSVLKADGGGRR